MLESKTENVSMGENIEAVDDTLWVEDMDELDAIGNSIYSALDSWCGLKGVKFIYIRKAGNHLEVGKAEINCIE